MSKPKLELRNPANGDGLVYDAATNKYKPTSLGAGGPHAASHQPGGSDALAVDAAAGTGSLRTLGTGAAQACAGNDGRLTDDRAPTAHNHDASALNAGTVATARLGSGAADATKFLRGDQTWAAPAGGSSPKHLLASNTTIAAGDSHYVTRYLEVAAGVELELGADADLEVG